MNRLSRIQNVFLLGLVTAGLLRCTAPVKPLEEDTTSVSLSFRLPVADKTGIQAFAPPPTGVTEIEIKITGGGMPPITDLITGLSGGVVSRTYSLPSGADRIFSAIAYEGVDPSRVLSYSGSSQPLTLISGVLYNVVIPMTRSVDMANLIIGDTVQVRGSGFGDAQGTSVINIGGVRATRILRWSDTKIAAIIPPGVSVPGVADIVVIVAGVSKMFPYFNVLDHTHAVGGEDDHFDFDKMLLPQATPTITLSNIGSTDAGATSSIVLSGDFNIVAEADPLFYGYQVPGVDGGERVLGYDVAPTIDRPFGIASRDVAISWDGSTVLHADGTDTLILLTDFTTVGPQPIYNGGQRRRSREGRGDSFGTSGRTPGLNRCER